MTFYERLLDELKYKGLTIATLAKEIEVADSTIRNFKNNVMPKADLVVKIADYLQVSVSWLVSGHGEKLQHSYREMSESLSEIASKIAP